MLLFGAQIDFAHPFILLDVADRSLGQQLAMCITVTMSAICRTKPMSCSTTMMVWFFLSSFSISIVLPISCSVIPATGSSNSSSDGFCMRTMPISSHWVSPWESVPAITESRSLRPTSTATCSSRSAQPGTVNWNMLRKTRVSRL